MNSKRVFYGLAGGFLGYTVIAQTKDKIPLIMTTVAEKSIDLKGNVNDSIKESFNRIKDVSNKFKTKNNQPSELGCEMQEQNILENVEELEKRLDNIKATINHL